MALSGAEHWMAVRAVFPLSLVVILSSVPFSIDLDILDFFPNCSYTVFALPSRDTSDMPRTESSLAASQDYLDFCYLSSARALDPNVKMGQGHNLLDPTLCNYKKKRKKKKKVFSLTKIWWSHTKYQNMNF